MVEASPSKYLDLMDYEPSPQSDQESIVAEKVDMCSAYILYNLDNIPQGYQDYLKHAELYQFLNCVYYLSAYKKEIVRLLTTAVLTKGHIQFVPEDGRKKRLVTPDVIFEVFDIPKGGRVPSIAFQWREQYFSALLHQQNTRSKSNQYLNEHGFKLNKNYMWLPMFAVIKNYLVLTGRTNDNMNCPSNLFGPLMEAFFFKTPSNFAQDIFERLRKTIFTYTQQAARNEGLAVFNMTPV